VGDKGWSDVHVLIDVIYLYEVLVVELDYGVADVCVFRVALFHGVSDVLVGVE
jgi:hypothetical protein